jgi:hypothetical protein
MKPLLTSPKTGRAQSADASDDGSNDDTLGRGMDVALTMLVFLGVGYLIDAWLGLFPLFTISLVVFAAVGAFVRMKYVYDATMERHEATRRAKLAASSTPVAPIAPIAGAAPDGDDA